MGIASKISGFVPHGGVCLSPAPRSDKLRIRIEDRDRARSSLLCYEGEHLPSPATWVVCLFGGDKNQNQELCQFQKLDLFYVSVLKCLTQVGNGMVRG
jgi:hypothetical protein